MWVTRTQSSTKASSSSALAKTMPPTQSESRTIACSRAARPFMFAMNTSIIDFATSRYASFTVPLLRATSVENLGVELFLIGEVAVEAAVSHTGGRHDLTDRDIREPPTVEQTRGGFDNPAPRFHFVLGLVRHALLQSR